MFPSRNENKMKIRKKKYIHCNFISCTEPPTEYRNALDSLLSDCQKTYFSSARTNRTNLFKNIIMPRMKCCGAPEWECFCTVCRWVFLLLSVCLLIEIRKWWKTLESIIIFSDCFLVAWVPHPTKDRTCRGECSASYAIRQKPHTAHRA